MPLISPGAGDSSVVTADVTAIRDVTDLLPNAGALLDLALIQAVTNVIPGAGALTVPLADAIANVNWGDVLGQKGDVANETVSQASAMGLLRKILVEVHEVERHLHGDRRWWGALIAPSETNAIESNVSRPFVVVSGNDDWGPAIPILGTGDNPCPLATDTVFDPNYILVVDTDDVTEYKFRSIYGTGTSAAAIIANQYTEDMFITAGGPFSSGVPVEMGHDRVPVGYKMWAQLWNVNDGSAASFYWNVHGYPV